MRVRVRTLPCLTDSGREGGLGSRGSRTTGLRRDGEGGGRTFGSRTVWAAKEWTDPRPVTLPATRVGQRYRTPLSRSPCTPPPYPAVRLCLCLPPFTCDPVHTPPERRPKTPKSRGGFGPFSLPVYFPGVEGRDPRDEVSVWLDSVPTPGPRGQGNGSVCSLEEWQGRTGEGHSVGGQDGRDSGPSDLFWDLCG